jgi:hypothetical protein
VVGSCEQSFDFQKGGDSRLLKEDSVYWVGYTYIFNVVS